MRQKRLDITEQDILAEIDRLRPPEGFKRRQFTEQQDAALLLARRCPPERQVHWRTLREWWEKKWGAVSEDTLRRRLHELMEEQK